MCSSAQFLSNKSTRLFIIIIILLSLSNNTAFSQQDSATVIVITNMEGTVLIDGIDRDTIHAGAAFRSELSAGEHYIEVKTSSNGSPLSKGEIVQLESEKKEIVKIDFDLNTQTQLIDTIPVAEVNFDLPGTVATIAWQTNHPNQDYPYPEYYYAFEKGDIIVLNASMSNKNGTNTINISTYPDEVSRYSNNAFVELKDLRIEVPERAIYKFTFATNHAFDRNCFLKVGRIPASKETADFNTTVTSAKIPKPIVIHEPQSFYINSGSNATFMGGKSRVILPIELPPNTVEWFYRFSASREEEDIANIQKDFSLISELSSLMIDLSGTSTVIKNLTVDMLKQPPGADICDILLLTNESRDAFESKNDDQWKYYPDASRLNFASGNVKVTCCTDGPYYLGIRNPDKFNGINVSIEVVAITAEEKYVMVNEN